MGNLYCQVMSSYLTSFIKPTMVEFIIFIVALNKGKWKYRRISRDSDFLAGFWDPLISNQKLEEPNCTVYFFICISLLEFFILLLFLEHWNVYFYYNYHYFHDFFLLKTSRESRIMMGRWKYLLEIISFLYFLLISDFFVIFCWGFFGLSVLCCF